MNRSVLSHLPETYDNLLQQYEAEGKPADMSKTTVTSYLGFVSFETLFILPFAPARELYTSFYSNMKQKGSQQTSKKGDIEQYHLECAGPLAFLSETFSSVQYQSLTSTALCFVEQKSGSGTFKSTISKCEASLS